MKRLCFITGTRADYGKIKSLIQVLVDSGKYKVRLFVTGMHLEKRYGLTVNEIYKDGFKELCFLFRNNNIELNSMAWNLSKTIQGLEKFIKRESQDLLILHGDRPETLAGAIVGSFNNILVCHIEGGELSGTIDEMIRHSVSKLSHIHAVSNKAAQKRLIQLGESKKHVHIIGSPDFDVMMSKDLPTIDHAKEKYEIPYDNYAIVLFHPVTTEISNLKDQIKILMQSLLESDRNYIVIYPNNDHGSNMIIEAYDKLRDIKNFRILPSINFEHFLTLMKNADFIIGNSSAGVREAPFFNIPSINLGTRQSNRAKSKWIINSEISKYSILNAIQSTNNYLSNNQHLADMEFHQETTKSRDLFINLLDKKTFWETPIQKSFIDL